MKYCILFGLLGLLSLAISKDRVKYFPIDQIKAGRHLDEAQQKTFHEFIDWRLYCTDKKWTPCSILLTTDSFIYFGYVFEATAGFFSKVLTDEVVTRFPLSLVVDGDSIRNLTEKFLAQQYPWGPKRYAGRPITYRDSGILVKLWCEVKSPVWHNPERTKILTDSVLLNKTDLSIIK